MVWAILTAVVGGFLVVAGILLLVRRLGGGGLVSPILLDDALDADLRRIRKQLRVSGQSLQTRRRLGRQLILLAARRASDGDSVDDRDALRRLADEARRAD